MIRILIADDHKIIREGLRSLLAGIPDVQVVAEADNGRTAVNMAWQTRPDIVITDIRMPELDGISAASRMLDENPKVKIIVLSMHADREFVEKSLKTGISGYLLKECAFKELSEAIRTVMAGDTYLSPAIERVVLEGYVHLLRRKQRTTCRSIDPLFPSGTGPGRQAPAPAKPVPE